jgi:division protein CdvB (Snf7/Vps24/ESCRT-III family)
MREFGSTPIRYFQQMKMSLAEAEANVASLRARVSEYESRVQSS